MKRGRQPAGAGEGEGDGGRRSTRQRRGSAAAADSPPAVATATAGHAANEIVPALAGPVVSAAAAGAVATPVPEFTATGFAMLLGEMRARHHQLEAALIETRTALGETSTALTAEREARLQLVIDADNKLRWALGNAGPGLARGLNAATRPWPEHVLVTHPHAHEGAILGKILGMLDAEGLKAAGQVCRAWDQAAQFYRVTRLADGTVREPACGVFDATVAPGQSVQAAVNGVRSGGCVLLLPETHQGKLVLTKKVHLFGRGQAQLEGANAHVIWSETPTATVDGLTIRCLANVPPSTGIYGAVYVASGGVRFQGCEFSSVAGSAVCARGELAAPHFVNCRFRDSNRNGLEFGDHASGRVDSCDFSGYGQENAGVFIASGDPVVSNCTFHSGDGPGTSGIILGSPASIGRSTGRYENCTMVGGKSGIEISEAADPLVIGCIFRESAVCGALVSDSGKGRFRMCSFVDGQGDGLLIKYGGDPVLEAGNVIKNNKRYGVCVSYTALGKATIDPSTVFEGNGEGDVFRNGEGDVFCVEETSSDDEEN